MSRTFHICLVAAAVGVAALAIALLRTPALEAESSPSSEERLESQAPDTANVDSVGPNASLGGGRAEVSEYADVSGSAGNEDSGRKDWLREQQLSENLAQFVRNSATSAYEGDADAQLAIARAIHLCRTSLEVTREHPDYTQPLQPTFAVQAARCRDWAEERLFAALPSAETPYDFDYWLNRAVDANHPVAVAWQVARQISASIESQTELNEVSTTLQTLVQTRIPAVHFYIGMALATVKHSDDDLRPAAWALFACRHSACAEVPEMRFSDPCDSLAGMTCDAQSQIYYEAQRDMGIVPATRIMTLSYQIESSVQRAAWEELDLSMRARAPRQ